MKLANAAFTPAPEKVERARKILRAAGGAANGGVVQFEGKTILMPGIRQAELLVKKAEMMGM